MISYIFQEHIFQGTSVNGYFQSHMYQGFWDWISEFSVLIRCRICHMLKFKLDMGGRVPAITHHSCPLCIKKSYEPWSVIYMATLKKSWNSSTVITEWR